MNASFELLSKEILFGMWMNRISFQRTASQLTSCPSESRIFNVRRMAYWRDCLVSSPTEGRALYLPKTFFSDDIDETRFAFIIGLWGTSGAPQRPRTQRNTIVMNLFYNLFLSGLLNWRHYQRRHHIWINNRLNRLKTIHTNSFCLISILSKIKKLIK